MAVETSSRYQKLLVASAIKEVAERTYKEQHEIFDARKEFYSDMDLDMAYAEFYGINGLGNIPKFNGKLEALVRSPGFLSRFEPIEHAAKEMWERKFLDDKQFDVMNDDSKELARSSYRTIDTSCAIPFVYATSAALEYMTYNEEGVALVSSSHTTKSGASTTTGFSNTAALALTPANLATVRLQGANIKDANGYRIGTNFDTLIVPNALAQTAFEITGTDKGLYSGEGTTNYWKGKYKVIVWNRLDDYDTNDWYLVDFSMMKQNLKYLKKFDPEFESNHDFETKITSLSVYFRFGLGYKDWRWVIKSTVS
ncbi:MAG: Mu-like prophage major head subunit gpT family protein [Syntrophales bacterium]|nr:Mu-like prophage major head subunit gpT family protein [Syntrophales bacterium]